MGALEENELHLQHYLKTNRLLRARAVLLSVVFILILGLQHNKERSEEKRSSLYGTILAFESVLRSDSIKNALDSIKNDYSYSLITDRFIHSARMDKLLYELEKSNYIDKAPILDVIVQLEKEISELGLESEDYQFSVLGFNSTVSDWLYLAPIILLVLYTDMTCIFLYRKSLREKLLAAGVTKSHFGPELFGLEHEDTETSTAKFLSLVTAFFIGVLLVLPLIPAFIAAVSYLNETSDSEKGIFIMFIQWIAPIVMLIELGIIFYTENVFKSQKLIDKIGFHLKQLPSKRTLVEAFIGYALLTVIYVNLAQFVDPNESFDFELLLSIVPTNSVLPIAIWFLVKHPDNFKFRALRLIGRGMSLFWSLNLILFLLDHSDDPFPHYNNEFLVVGSWIFLATLIPASIIYYHVCRPKIV